MKPHYLYKITNLVNGKMYIGITSRPEARFKQHMSGKSSLLLKNAVNKYGVESFKFEILVIGEKDYIANLEMKTISLYSTQSKESGYNIKPGGEKGLSGYFLVKTAKDKWQYVSGFWFPNPRTAIKILGINSSTFKRRRKDGVLGDIIQNNLWANWEDTPIYVGGFWWGNVFIASNALDVTKEALKNRLKKGSVEQSFNIREQKGAKNHMHNISQKDHPSSKRVKIEGVSFDSIKQATEVTGYSKYVITSRIKEGHKDFSIINEDT